MDRSEQILSLKLLNGRERPFILFRRNGLDVVALFDTGALTPIWCMGLDRFKAVYPEAVDKKKSCEVSGFGEKPIRGKVFVIPCFELFDDVFRYAVKNLHIAVCTHPAIGCDFVMSDTMFSHTDTLLQRRSGKRMEIRSDKSEYYCTPKWTDKRFTVATWSQDS